GKMSEQIKVVSGTVTDMGDDHSIPKNFGTENAIAAANPELAAKMRSQYESVKNLKTAKEEPDAGKKVPEEGEEEEGDGKSTSDAFHEANKKNPHSSGG